MWERLSITETTERRVTYAKKLALFLSTCTFLVVFISIKTGHRKYVDKSYWDTLSWEEAIYQIPAIFLLSILVYILSFNFQKLRRPNNAVFCTSCGKSYGKHQKGPCSCGGLIDYLADYKYVEKSQDQKP